MSTARVLAQKPPWLARLPRLDGDTIAGAGMLVDERHVVTCAHVVAQQVGQPAVSAGCGEAPDHDVLVEFPFADGVVRRSAAVVSWQPIAQDLSGDAAVLRLAEPVALTHAPLACPPSLHGHGFWVHGFPGGDRATRQAQGRLGGASGPAGEWIQVESTDSSGWPVGHGFSGAPVFDHQVDAVVGIVALRDEHRAAHVLPMSYLRTLWPWLGDRVGWRLDLDPNLKTHWLPRARGSEVESDSGAWYFTGRHTARQAVCDWLTDPAQPALVVTGGPGTGKSALLAHLLLAADPVLASSVPTGGPSPPVGAFDIAIQAAGLTRDDLVHRLAAAAGIEATTSKELLVGVRERRQAGHRPLMVLIDAVEEADSIEEAQRIATLLRTLAGTGAARVLAGVRTAPASSDRARVLTAFGRSAPRIDLESRQFMRNHDVADYVERRLTGEETGPVRYRGRPPDELRAIGQAVARKARYNFLIAQLATRWLIHPSTPPLNLDDPAWQHGLPETIGQALDAYLDTCGPYTALVRRLLTALAFARGDGLARDRVWLTIADALHPTTRAHTPTELEIVFDSAAHYLIERTNHRGGQPSYRLYHDALDEHLREQCIVRDPRRAVFIDLELCTGTDRELGPVRDPHRAIVTALTDLAPRRDEHRDWGTADLYTRTHLAGHAVQAHRLDELLKDVGFLLNTEPGPLLAALPHAATKQGQLAAAVYRLSNSQHRHASLSARCRALALDAARLGAVDLQHQLNTAQGSSVMPATQSDWRVSLATGSILPTAMLGTLTGHTNPVRSIAVAEIDGRPIVLTGTGSDDNTVWIWDLVDHRQIGQLVGHEGHVNAVAVTELDGRPTAITAGNDKTLRIWDLAEQCQIGRSLSHPHAPNAIAVADVNGRPVAVTCSKTAPVNPGAGVVRIWDLVEQRQIGVLADDGGVVGGVAVAYIDGRPIVVTCGTGGVEDDGAVRIWDLVEQRQIGVLADDGGVVGGVAVAYIDGRPIVVTCGTGGVEDDGAVRIWDLVEQRQIGVLADDGDLVRAVAVAYIDGRPIGVTCSGAGSASPAGEAVRLWDLIKHLEIGQGFTGHTGGIEAVAVAELDGRPIAITGGSDKTVRIWDLAEQRDLGHPIAGHSAAVTATAVMELDGRHIAITGDMQTARIWDPVERREIGQLAGAGFGTAVAGIKVEGDPIALTIGGDRKAVHLWYLHNRKRRGLLVDTEGGGQEHPLKIAAVTAMAVAEIDGRPVALTAGRNDTRRVQVTTWDLGRHWAIDRIVFGHTGHAISAAFAELDGRPIVVICWTDDKYQGPTTIGMVDLITGRQIGSPFTCDANDATAMVVAQVNGRLSAIISTGRDNPAVRIWDLAERRDTGHSFVGHTTAGNVIIAAELDGRPIVITGGDDTIRVWDLNTSHCLDTYIMPSTIGSLALGENGTLVVGFGPDVAVFDTPLNITVNMAPPIPRLRRRPIQPVPVPTSRRPWWRRIVKP